MILEQNRTHQRNCTLKTYTHLSHEERFFIHVSTREGMNQKEIAEALGRSPSTICREMKRGMWPRSYLYSHHWAVQFWGWRKSVRKDRLPRKITPELASMILALIREYLSPEQVSGYLLTHFDIAISHETIYTYINSDKALKTELKPFLRQGAKMRRKKYGSGARASAIPNRKPLSERPAIVDKKTRIGDWECDTVIGKDRRSVLVTVVERKTLFTVSMKVPRKTAANVAAAMIKLLTPYKDLVKTLTFDNGTEFTQHEKIGKALKAKTYFAAPYASWERGINENTNGLLRQFFPKGTDFAEVTQKEIKQAVERLNNRPRKTRGYKTPNQLFKDLFVPLI